MSDFEFAKPSYRELVGGDLVAQSLKRLGVSVAFGIHGGHLDAFLMGANDIGIRLVDTRHETVAIQAAEGYAKVSNEMGVCFVTANSGFSNGLPGLATAFADRSPIFCITSSIPLRDAEANALQGFHDQIVVSKPITKFSHRVTCVEEIPRLIAHAFRVSMAGAPGPTLIDFPIDILFSPVNTARLSLGSLLSPKSWAPSPHPDAVLQAWRLLTFSKRPAIVTGTGAYCLLDFPPWQKYINRVQIPVFNSMKWSSPLAFDAPMRAGYAANLAALKASGNEGPDVIMLLGCRTGFFFGSRSNPVLPKANECKYIHVDVDSGEVGRDLEITCGIISEVRTFIEALEKQSSPQTPTAEWKKLATSFKSNSIETHEKEPVTLSPGFLHPYHALKSTFASLKAGAMVSTDGGDCGAWAVVTLENARFHTTMFSPGYLGFLGNGFGYSLGAAIAQPTKQIINIQGDGSAGMHLMELDTYARHKCNILTVVVNNHGWGMSANGQELVYGKGTDARPTTALSPHMSFETVAQGLGCSSVRVNKLEDIQAAVEKLSKSDGPGLLELITSKKPIHPGTIAMVGDTTNKDEIVVPYYDNLPRSQLKH